MPYTLRYNDRCGLWELQISRFRARYYCSRYGAEKLVTRYRRMLQAEQAVQAETILERVHQYIRSSFHGSNFHGPVVKLDIPWEAYSEALVILESASSRNGGKLGRL